MQKIFPSAENSKAYFFSHLRGYEPVNFIFSLFFPILFKPTLTICLKTHFSSFLPAHFS